MFQLSKTWLGAGTLLLLQACSSGERAQTPTPAFDPTYLDQSADPCVDFYQFACGTWLAQHSVSAGYVNARYYSGDLRDQIYYGELLGAMTSADATLQPAQSYYRECLTAHERTVPVSRDLAELFSLVSALKSTADLPVTLAALHARGIRAFFHADPRVDPQDPSHYVVTLSDGGWTLPTRTAYDDADLATSYRAHMQALPAAGPPAIIRIDPDAVFALERSIAQSGDDGLNPVALNTAISTPELTGENGSFDWKAYFSARSFGSVTHENLRAPRFPAEFEKALATTTVDTVRQYLTWRVLETFASAEDQPLITEETHFHREILSGQSTPPSDEYQCLQATRDVFGFALAKHFVATFVKDDVRPDANGIVSALRTAMQTNLDAVSWLDTPTRSGAQDKLELLLAKVGYPDTWPATPSFDPGSDYLQMQEQLYQSAALGAASALSGPVDRTAFVASPDTTNAFYSDELNSITIPVAVLQHPFFDSNAGSAFNLGVLGSVVGHELTHAFDNNGRFYDGNGALADWWTKPVAAEFEHRAQCLVDQYDEYEALPGLNVSGVQTLPENIADLGGVKLSWAAFQALPNRGVSAASFTSDEQFFLAFAQVWCENDSEQALTTQVANDPHSPAKFRVNGVVRNLPEFAQAFSCPSGTPLAPAERCQIW